MQSSASFNNSSALHPLVQPQRPLAWADTRHTLSQQHLIRGDIPLDQESEDEASKSHMSMVMACLNLSHESSLRSVGAYCGVLPSKKDPHGSTLRIMKAYSQAIQAMDPANKVAVRSVPDPNRAVIQHHLLRSRQLAGPDAYILAIYNGHGIQEAPTVAGELWSYDVSFEECQLQGTNPSEYIPSLLFDLLSYAGASALWVWDVKHAGRLVNSAKQESAEIDRQLTVAAQSNPEIAITHPPNYSRNQIHFAACQADQTLPRYPAGLPDDLFTACLLEPLRMALLFHNLEIAPMGTLDAQASRSAAFMDALWAVMSDKLKARLSRDLHAVLCTIAWKTLDSWTYHQLFAQGGVVSKASAGFILAQRVMAAYGVQPTSTPTIPSGLAHPLWTTWDLCLSTFFEQLPEQFMEGDEWQEELELLGFLADQLQSVITINQGEGQRSIAQEGALSRLPIILQAAHVDALEQQACRC